MSRDVCAFCGAEIGPQEPVAFALTPAGDGYEWHTDGALVASAVIVNGLWQLYDARGGHVVTLVPVSGSITGAPSVALVGPRARLIGSIRAEAEGGGSTVVTDGDGRTALVLRTDGSHAAHLVDHRGDVVAVSSWEPPATATDVLVTALGTRHSLALVFGLLLSFEVSRRTANWQL
ncbi:MAG TPA: hypothetical protein VMU14_08550 [Acidimicrobiales bacterium]|nr:hypothetical protein [Acidimicrobiales bacterium]